MSTLQKKVFSRAILKWFSLYDWDYSDSLGISLFQEKRFYRSFEIVATLCKKSFWRTPVKCFSLYGSYNSDSVVFWNATFEEIKDHSLTTTHLQNKISNGNFEFLSTLRKKVFARGSESSFSLDGSNNSGSLVFETATFREIKDHSLIRKAFQKIIFSGSFEFPSTLCKKVFSRVKWSEVLSF